MKSLKLKIRFFCVFSSSSHRFLAKLVLHTRCRFVRDSRSLFLLTGQGKKVDKVHTLHWTFPFFYASHEIHLQFLV